MVKLTPEVFWSRKTIIEKTGCWEWNGERDRGGYGKLQCTFVTSTRLTHRIAWILTFGPTEGLQVLHKCDNPPCINPAHLFLGTQMDNRLDMLAKNRQNDRRGEGNGFHILTVEQVLDIKASYIPRICTLQMLADRHNVHIKTVHDIIQGKTWTHIKDNGIHNQTAG